ncbi:MAG: LysR family transcriptional regulator [Magnetospirillum sp.]|nr:LysR family transcriptional regulator [Magnetospirillum sp.]
MDPTRADLADLGTFLVVARLRSFRGAATQLGVTASAVSHAIRGLEERLGVRLLNRTTRSVVPTQAGEQLLARLEPAFRDVYEGLEEINATRDTPSGTLRLNVPRGAAHFVIAPMVAAYLRAYPRMRLEIIAEDSLVDVVAGGFDAGVRFNESIPKDMIAVPLGPGQRFAVVGAPAYLAERGIPEKPEDLTSHTCIRWRFSTGGYYRWEFEKDGEARVVPVDGPLATNDNHLVLQATLDGAGLAFLFEQDAAPHLESGRLVRVLADWCPVFSGFYLYYPSRRQVHPGLRAFIDMLRPG